MLVSPAMNAQNQTLLELDGSVLSVMILICVMHVIIKEITVLTMIFTESM